MNWNTLKDAYDKLDGADKQAVALWYDDLIGWADVPYGARGFIELVTCASEHKH